MIIQRRGIDMDPVRPWVWASMLFNPYPLEVVSYSIPREGAKVGDLRGATIMVRRVPGDPTSIIEIAFSKIACFDRDRHKWWYERERIYYSDDPNVFLFKDAKGAEFSAEWPK